MSEEDDFHYRRRLNEVLRQHGFSWVVDQAEVQIADGKPSSKQISEKESLQLSEDSFELRRPRSRRASLITTEPYAESEKLDILLSGIEAAVAQRAALEQAIFEQAPELTSVSFERDSPSEDGDSPSLGKAHFLSSDRKQLAHSLESEVRSSLAKMRQREQ